MSNNPLVPKKPIIPDPEHGPKPISLPKLPKLPRLPDTTKIPIPVGVPEHLYTVSELRTYATCPRKHAYRYVAGLVPIEQDKKLTEGTIIHEALADAYSGGDWNPLQTWAARYDDLEALAVEHPLIVSGYGAGYSMGGVLDMVAQNMFTEDKWVVDWKTVNQWWDYPEQVAREQLGMYVNLLRAIGIDYPIAGGVLSRIYYRQEVASAHAVNYLLKQLKKRELAMSKGLLADLERAQLRALYPSPKRRGEFRKQVHRPRVPRLVIRDEAGHVTTWIGYIGRNTGALIHIERTYYPFNDSELFTVAMDLQGLAAQLERGTFPSRTPGIHCNQCPYVDMCKAEYNQPFLQSLLQHADKFGILTEHSEVAAAIERWKPTT